MSARKIHLASSFSLLVNPKDLAATGKEIQKVNPEVEVSIEGLSELAKGTVVEWHPSRKFFAVQWKKISPEFAEKTNSNPDLRVFFKAQLFTTQLVFKTQTIRRVSTNVYHYRIPEHLYKQQRRGALRVPITSGITARLETPFGVFSLLDLSVSGAKFRVEHAIPAKHLHAPLQPCTLILGRKKISNPKFEIKITHLTPDTAGTRFSGLSAAENILIKQFLVDALRNFYQSEL